MKKTGIMACFLLVCVCMRLNAGELLICGACGYEQTVDVQVCTHCGAALERPAQVLQDVAPNDDAELPAEKSETAGVLMVALRQDIQDGDAAWQAGNAAMAYLFWRNALGLARVAGMPAAEVAATLPEKIEQARRTGSSIQENCRTCNGTGKRFMDSVGLRGDVSRVEVHGSVCQDCAGRGYLMRPARYSERRRQRTEAVRQYAIIQQGRLRQISGQAWVPESIIQDLGSRDTALLRTSVAAPCTRCDGVGADDCRTCDGSGRIPCTERGCRDGWIEVRGGGQLTGQPLVNRRRCALCQGAGTLVCGACNGVGGIECTACNGSGQRPLCRRCDGAGIADCARCRGSGEVRGAPCDACRGEKLSLCNTCQGDGRSR